MMPACSDRTGRSNRDSANPVQPRSSRNPAANPTTTARTIRLSLFGAASRTGVNSGTQTESASSRPNRNGGDQYGTPPPAESPVALAHPQLAPARSSAYDQRQAEPGDARSRQH